MPVGDRLDDCKTETGSPHSRRRHPEEALEHSLRPRRRSGSARQSGKAIGLADREVGDEDENDAEEDEAGEDGAEIQPIGNDRLGEIVAPRGAERAGQDIGYL